MLSSDETSVLKVTRDVKSNPSRRKSRRRKSRRRKSRRRKSRRRKSRRRKSRRKRNCHRIFIRSHGWESNDTFELESIPHLCSIDILSKPGLFIEDKKNEMLRIYTGKVPNIILSFAGGADNLKMDIKDEDNKSFIRPRSVETLRNILISISMKIQRPFDARVYACRCTDDNRLLPLLKDASHSAIASYNRSSIKKIGDIERRERHRNLMIPDKKSAVKTCHYCGKTDHGALWCPRILYKRFVL